MQATLTAELQLRFDAVGCKDEEPDLAIGLSVKVARASRP